MHDQYKVTYQTIKNGNKKKLVYTNYKSLATIKK